MSAFLPTPPLGVPALPLWLKGVDQGLLHPTPTEGFEGRLITLFTLSSIYTLLAAFYGVVSLIRTEERPRSKALWFSRLVSRPSGRFIVLNPRCAWSIGGVLTGLWSLALVWYNYRAFLQGGDQSAMWGMRGMNHFVFFLVSWPISWAGAQAFLLTAESHKSKLPSARTCNLVFLVGGFLIASLSFTFAMYQSIQGQRFWNAGIALRQTLYEFSQISLSGSPTEEQMKVLVPMAQATTKAWNGLQTATIVHASFSPIPPIACLIVNFGGFRLVAKLHRQIKESTSLFALSNPGRFTNDDPSTWRGPSPSSSPAPALKREDSDYSSAVYSPPIISSSEMSKSSSSQLTTLQNLKRAEIDMAALTVFFTILCLAYTVGFILADYLMSVDAANTWPLAEGAFGASLWSTVIVGTVLYAFLIFNSLSDRLVSPLSTVAFDPRTSKNQKLERNPSKLQTFLPTLKRNSSQYRTTPTNTRPEREVKIFVQVERDEEEEEEEKKFEIP